MLPTAASTTWCNIE